MTHTYQISGMTCSGCEAKVKHLLEKLPGVLVEVISKDSGLATVSMQKHWTDIELQRALGVESKYQIGKKESAPAAIVSKSWTATYKPILLIFGYITGVVVAIQFHNDSFNWSQAMRHFMGGFFLVFSFFKMLNLRGFAESYAMYDVVARRIPVWGYLYTFIELALGIAFVIDFAPFATNLLTLIVMSVSIVGVLQSVLNNQKIQCACLGAVFNLPMSTVTIVEDLLMIVMSAAMLMMM